MATRTPYVSTEVDGDVLTAANFNKLPNGLVAYFTTSTATTAIGTSYADITGLTAITFTFQASRLYRFESRIRVASVSTTLRATTILISSGGATTYGIMGEGTVLATEFASLYGSLLYAPGAGSLTLKMQAKTSASTMNTSPGSAVPNATGPDFVAIYDVSPSF